MTILQETEKRAKITAANNGNPVNLLIAATPARFVF
jgi:hypothetical protein